MGERDRPEPILSEFADDPTLDGRIDAFVVGLAERNDLIQDADGQGDLKQAGVLAANLVLEAAALGFPPLADAARAVQGACAAEDPERVHACVVELTQVVQRVRLGYRGAS